MNDVPKTDPDLRKELSREAGSLLENVAFKTATALLHRQWYGELISAGSDTPRVLNLTAKLQTLEAIPRLLAHLVDNEKMARGIHGGRR